MGCQLLPLAGIPQEEKAEMKHKKEENKIEPTMIKMSFDPIVAKEVGVEEAIMLSNIEYWTYYNKVREEEKPKDERPHFKDGKWWTYNSAVGFTKLFPFWTDNQIERILTNLRKAKYIESNNTYNESKYDKTNWYSARRVNEGIVDENKLADSRKRGNRKAQTGEPIPNDIKPVGENTNGKLFSDSAESPKSTTDISLSEISEENNSVNLPEKIAMWKEVTPKYKDFFKNKTERANLQKLYKTFPEQEVDLVIQLLPKTNKLLARGQDSFFWKIFKPSDLYKHWEQWTTEFSNKKQQVEQQKNRVNWV